MRWKGVILFVVIVPIPLVIPVGHDTIELEIVDGMVTSAWTRNDEVLWEAFLGLPLHGMWRGINERPSNAVGDQFRRY